MSLFIPPAPTQSACPRPAFSLLRLPGAGQFSRSRLTLPTEIFARLTLRLSAVPADWGIGQGSQHEHGFFPCRSGHHTRQGDKYRPVTAYTSLSVFFAKGQRIICF